MWQSAHRRSTTSKYTAIGKDALASATLTTKFASKCGVSAGRARRGAPATNCPGMQRDRPDCDHLLLAAATLGRQG
jgi:hypothetical protein